MLEPEEILHGTKAILEFIGAKMEQAYPAKKRASGIIVTYPRDAPWPELSNSHSLDTSKYHVDFNWLMPVVIKINESGRYHIRIDSLTATVIDDEVPEFADKNMPNVVDREELLIEAIFSCCWEAIELINALNEPTHKIPLTC